MHIFFEILERFLVTMFLFQNYPFILHSIEVQLPAIRIQMIILSCGLVAGNVVSEGSVITVYLIFYLKKEHVDSFPLIFRRADRLHLINFDIVDHLHGKLLGNILAFKK